MKKIAFIYLVLLCSFYSFSQNGISETKELHSGKLGFGNKWKIESVIKDGDTTIYFSYAYKDTRYPSLNEFGIVLLRIDELNEFIETLEIFANKEGKVTINVDKKNYSIYLYDFNPSMIYLSSRDKETTAFTKSNAKKFIIQIREVLNQNKF
jgi:hypothetical protein